MNTSKFKPGDMVAVLDAPGWTGRVVMVDLSSDYEGEVLYLLDCCPGAMGGYGYFILPEGMLPYGTLLAGNWVLEHKLEALASYEARQKAMDDLTAEAQEEDMGY